MSARIIHRPLRGEQVIAVDPQVQQQAATTWQKRLRMFTGRALSDVALSAEQDYRSGHLSHSGRLLTSGVVTGLEISLDMTNATAPVLVLGAGQGIALSGEDVNVPSVARIPLAGVSVFDPQAQNTQPAGEGAQTAVSKNFVQFTAAATATTPRAGIFVLQPIVIQFAGNPAGAANDVIDITQQLLTSPDRDPDEYAFEDWQIMDGCRLVFYPWPADRIPLPAAGALFRNRVANSIFAMEAAFGRGEHFPWEEAGVPLGVAAFDNAWKPLFIDVSSVVRRGGLPRRVLDAPFEETWPAGNPEMAEAQIQQFLEQNATIPTATPPTALSANFQFLPPLGILPISSIDLTNFPTFKNRVFPANYSVNAEPIFADELEDFLAQSSELAPYDLTVADSVQILVPVAEADFDPALLKHEEINPEFTREMDTATANRVAALQHRNDLGAKANVMLKLLAQAAVNVNADLAADEQNDLKSALPYQAPATEAFGTAVVGGALASTDIADLKTAAAAVLSNPQNPQSRLVPDTDLQVIDTNGLQAFIDLLHQRIKQANDIIDLGFLRAQTDIYRFRQMVLDNTAATRLATSPVLNQIAQGDTAMATVDQIDKFFQSASGQKVSPPTKSPTYQNPAAAPLQLRIPPNMGGMGGIRPLAATTIPAALRSATLNRTLQPTPALINLGNTGIFNTSILNKISFPAPAPAATKPPAATTPTASTVQEQQPLVGGQLNFRTISVAERLKQSPGQEAAFFTGQNRSDVTQAVLSALPSHMIDDLPVDTIDPADGTKKTVTLGDLRKGTTPIEHLQVPPVKQDTDEGALFSAGVQLLEQHVAMLRQLEGRVAQYNRIIAFTEQTLSTIHSHLNDIDVTLKTVEDALHNARHAYTFTKALLQDETTRVNNMNARRTSVLQHNVPFVVWRRPRELDASIAEPAHQLFPDVASVLLPACLNRTAPVPPELRQMVNLLRHAPANWLPHVISILPKFERRDLVLGLASHMQISAQLNAQKPRPSAIAFNSSVYSDKINLAYAAHTGVMESYRQQRAGFQVSSLQSASWSVQVNSLLPIIGIGDLLGSDLGNLVTRPVARLIDEIMGVAACIYDRAGHALPVVRLAWADAFYLESDAADLHDLSVLPRWGEVQFEQRREMQMLVSWLFSQINQSIPQAMQFMSDVVRVAILLASDAPVTEIIQGSSLEPAPIRIGGLVRVSLPSTRIYQAMPVTIHHNGELIAHGLVDDLAETEAAIQITAVVNNKITSLPKGATIQYVTQSTWINSVNAGGAPRVSARTLLQ